MNKKYDFSKIEKKWQAVWRKDGIYVADSSRGKKKDYILVEFPYPSGEGLHMGHLRPYVAADVFSRFERMMGKEVLFPMGWDAFGLPAENYAIKKGIHPKITTARNIKNAKRQMISWGLSFDWSREINTTDPNYYKWTQWLFLRFYKAGLAYEATGIINWCPKDKTGLANEEVINGACERCGTPVEKKEMRQWYLKITAYAEKLLEGLKTLDWPERVKVQQENWIGKKVGIEIEYDVDGMKEKVRVFTTRPDTNFGATFVVLAPEHRLSQILAHGKHKKEVLKYIKASQMRKDEDRISDGRKKTGAFTGRYAVNHLTGFKMPIWVGDYVLAGFGTGAVVGVPGHDIRDFEFANEFDLEIVRVVRGGDGDTSAVSRRDQVREEEGTMMNSGFLDGMDIHKATHAIMDHMEEKGWGKRVVQYRLRDWVFSRQRYWGEPIPIIHCGKCGIVPVPEKDLPVKLPPVKKYEPTGTGESPLAAIKSWVNVKCPVCGGSAKRETNTMPQWAGSSWYWLRYTDPKNKKEFASKEKQKKWTPVDVYFGGMEHTTLHLLYSRFWNLFLYDQGLVTFREPYMARKTHGIILGPDGEKMSKSRGNIVVPDEIVKLFGADTLRMYELFLGPHEGTVPWKNEGIVGIKRFLDKVWKLANSQVSGTKRNSGKVHGTLEKLLHRTIKKVTEDIGSLHYNTAISALMILLNEMEDESSHLSPRTMELFLKLLAPFAPHVTEELWRGALGNKKSIHIQRWPLYDPALIKENTFTLIIQVNGKIRDSIEVPVGITNTKAESLALASEKVKAFLGTSIPKRVIYVPGRLVNIVV